MLGKPPERGPFLALLLALLQGTSLRGSIWEFPKIRDPNIIPYIVGSLLEGLPNKVPRFPKAQGVITPT